MRKTLAQFLADESVYSGLQTILKELDAYTLIVMQDGRQGWLVRLGIGDRPEAEGLGRSFAEAFNASLQKSARLKPHQSIESTLTAKQKTVLMRLPMLRKKINRRTLLALSRKHLVVLDPCDHELVCRSGIGAGVAERLLLHG